MKDQNIGKIGNFDPKEYVQPAQTAAKLSLIFGIISICTIIFDGIGVFPGIIGLVFALVADQRGNSSSVRLSGMLLSLIGTILSMLALFGLTYFYSCYTPEAETIASLILR